jgi:hypothetical protein
MCLKSLTPRKLVLVEKLIITYLVKKSCLLLYPNVYCSVQNSHLLEPVLSQTNPVHTLTAYSLKTYFNIIIPSTTCLPRVPFSSLYPSIKRNRMTRARNLACTGEIDETYKTAKRTNYDFYLTQLSPVFC